MKKNLLVFGLFLVLILTSLVRAETTIKAVPESGTSPLNVFFSIAPNEGTAAYAWDFTGDGIVDSDQSQPSYVYVQEGTYTAKVQITDSNAVTSDLTKIIKVYSPIQISITSNPSSGAVPLAVQFMATAIGKEPLTYAWDFNEDGIIDSTLQNPIYTFEKGGEYKSNLTVIEASGNKASKTITTNAIAYETKLNLASYFPKNLKVGEQEITLILTNEGNNTLQDVKAKIVGEGIQHLSSTSISSLKPGEQDSLTVKMNVLQGGDLKATVKIAGVSFPISFIVASEVQYNKNELSTRLNQLKEKFKQQETIYQEKKLEGYLVPDDSVKSLKTQLQNTEQQLLTGKLSDAKINLDLINSSLTDLTSDLQNAKKQERTFMMWLKENALAITAIIAAFGAVGGILVKVKSHAKKVGEQAFKVSGDMLHKLKKKPEEHKKEASEAKKEHEHHEEHKEEQAEEKKEDSI